MVPKACNIRQQCSKCNLCVLGVPEILLWGLWSQSIFMVTLNYYLPIYCTDIHSTKTMVVKLLAP